MTCHRTRSGSAWPNWRCEAASSPRATWTDDARARSWSPSSPRSSPSRPRPWPTTISAGSFPTGIGGPKSAAVLRIDSGDGRVAAVRDPDVADAGRHRGGMVADARSDRPDLHGPRVDASRPCPSKGRLPTRIRGPPRARSDAGPPGSACRRPSPAVGRSWTPICRRCSSTHTAPAPVAIAAGPAPTWTVASTASCPGRFARPCRRRGSRPTPSACRSVTSGGIGPDRDLDRGDSCSTGSRRRSVLEPRFKTQIESEGDRDRDRITASRHRRSRLPIGGRIDRVERGSAADGHPEAGGGDGEAGRPSPDLTVATGSGP